MEKPRIRILIMNRESYVSLFQMEYGDITNLSFKKWSYQSIKPQFLNDNNKTINKSGQFNLFIF
jgi:hypothetical protein